MEYLVVAEIEIDGIKIEHYTNITLRQKFNAHHEFNIRVNHDVLEKSGSFSLDNAKKKIGKSVLIRLHQLAVSFEVAYEFRGIICEIKMEQSGNSHSDLVLIGYSPTILIENGQNLASFYQSDLKNIVQKLTKPLTQVNCNVDIKPQYTKQIKYICQYKESNFHFLNRLSGEFSEVFYYDGKDLYFGKPASSKNIDITYGEDLSSMQLTLQALPMTFSNYSYISKEDKLEKYDAPSGVDGLGQYASYILKESNDLFSESVSLPIRQRIENKADLEGFVKKQKAAMAANLEVLSGTSYNPQVCIGAIISIKVSRLQDSSYIKEDYGKFLVTSIEHYVTENGKYYNTFEAISSEVEVIPVPNIIMPVGEPQLANVKDNKDPDNMGRVRVQMLWQKGNEMTDWLRVMTPDAGGGKSGAKNRGLVVIPEPGDQVLVCFRYNDPDRPFVMGSMFHGKTGGGGGQGNKSKSLTSLSGSVVSLDGDAINIIDANGNTMSLDGAGKININCSSGITLECGGSKIVMDSGGKIEISGAEITISGSSKATMKSMAEFKAEGTSASVHGVSTEIKGDAKVEVKSPMTTIKADALLKLQSGGVADLEGTAITNVKGGIVNLN